MASDLTGTIAVPLDPMLGPLDSDFVQPLLAGSPAIDAGDDAVLGAPNNLTTDQRGVPRKVATHVDIGAFEFEAAQAGPALVVTTTHEHNDGVCGSLDCTLGEAIAFANTNADPNTITFRTGLTGTITTRYTPDGVTLNTPVTIDGPGARILTISGADASRIFTIDVGPTVISGLTFANGRCPPGSGGAIATSAELTLNSCRFDKNFAPADGGAIYNVGPLTINNCTFSGNIADGGFGGATHSFSDTFARGNVTAINCTFSGNRAVGGGAVSNKASGRLGTTLLRNCTVSGNLASLNGTNTGGGLINQGTAHPQPHPTREHDRGREHSRRRLARHFRRHHLRRLQPGRGRHRQHRPNEWSKQRPGRHRRIADQSAARSLADNGGPTETRALLSTSPARDSANNTNAPPSDQRGYVRVGIADKGAYEFAAIVLRITNIARSGNDIVVTFDASAQRMYRLERRSEVGTGTWQQIMDVTPMTDGAAQLVDPGVLTKLGRANYRVRLLP